MCPVLLQRQKEKKNSHKGARKFLEVRDMLSSATMVTASQGTCVRPDSAKHFPCACLPVSGAPTEAALGDGEQDAEEASLPGVVS